MEKGQRKIRFGRFGLKEDPRGLTVTWTVGDRIFLATVTGVRYVEGRGCFLLQTRHFCGDEGPEVSACFVTVLFREADEYESPEAA